MKKIISTKSKGWDKALDNMTDSSPRKHTYFLNLVDSLMNYITKF